MASFWQLFTGLALITCTICTFLGSKWGRIEPAVLQRFQKLQERILAVEQEMVQIRTGVTGLIAQRRNLYHRESSSLGTNATAQGSAHHGPSLNMAMGSNGALS